MLIKLSKIFLRKVHVKTFCSAQIKKMSLRDSGISLTKVVSVLEDFAPKNLSESWDNTGLLIEPYSVRSINKILLTNDLTEDVASEADALRCEMIISYHPPIFAPLKSVTQSTWKERLVSLLLEKRIALYSPHTSWDSVRGGVNDWLSSCFHIQTSTPINPGVDSDVGSGRLLQLDESIKLSDAINAVKAHTGLSYVRVAVARGKLMNAGIQTVALCAGSGASVLKNIVADLYLTGEMLHHDVLDATQKGISVILTNHSDSERGFLKSFSIELSKRLENQVQVFVSKCDRDPLSTV